MNFKPKTEEELSRFECLPEGEYPFTVLESDEVPSKSKKNFGKLMAKLKLAVHRPDGGDQWVWDYFADWFSEWKLKHFLETTGNEEHYTGGSADFSGNGYQGAQGYVRIIIGQNDKGQDQNQVDDYVVKPATPAQSKAGFAKMKEAVNQPANSPESDDVPFN